MKANQAGQNLSAPAPAPEPQPGSDEASPVVRAVQGVHDSVDRSAASVANAIQNMQSSLNASVDKLGDKAERARQAGEDRAAGIRELVRNRPLWALAAAAAVGLLIARLSR